MPTLSTEFRTVIRAAILMLFLAQVVHAAPVPIAAAGTLQAREPGMKLSMLGKRGTDGRRTSLDIYPRTSRPSSPEVPRIWYPEEYSKCPEIGALHCDSAEAPPGFYIKTEINNPIVMECKLWKNGEILWVPKKRCPSPKCVSFSNPP